MARVRTQEGRSRIMAAIRSKNTKPELVVRRLLHSLGYRFRLHRKDLPGNPDLVFTARRKAIFVHGCFWHQHPSSDCVIARKPQSNTDYWGPKLARNLERDSLVETSLAELGWETMTIWECEIENAEAVRNKLVNFLGPQRIGSS